MNAEQKLQLLLGQQIFQIVGLQAQLEAAQKRIAELEADTSRTQSGDQDQQGT